MLDVVFNCAWLFSCVLFDVLNLDWVFLELLRLPISCAYDSAFKATCMPFIIVWYLDMFAQFDLKGEMGASCFSYAFMDVIWHGTA